MKEDKKLEEKLIDIYFKQSYSGFGENSKKDLDFITNNKFTVFIDEQTVNNGYASDQEKIKELKLNSPYTLKTMNVGRSSSTLTIEEFPGVNFNTVNFKFARKRKLKIKTMKKPIVIERKDDKEPFIHLGGGMYRALYGIKKNSNSETPLEAFDKTHFNFYYKSTKN